MQLGKQLEEGWVLPRGCSTETKARDGSWKPTEPGTSERQTQNRGTLSAFAARVPKVRRVLG